MNSSSLNYKAPPPQVQRSPLFRSLPEAKLVQRLERKSARAASNSEELSRNTVASSQLACSLVGEVLVAESRRPSSASIFGRAASVAAGPTAQSSAQAQHTDTVGSRRIVSIHERPRSAVANRVRSPVQQQTPPQPNNEWVALHVPFHETLRAYPYDVHRAHSIGTALDTSIETDGLTTQHQQVPKRSNDYCGTLFMIEQASQVRAYEDTIAATNAEEAFKRERRWALLRMRQVERDTRLQREATQKKRLREARVVARMQQEDVFATEKEVASHNERKERTHLEAVERRERRNIAYRLWASSSTIHFQKAFGALLASEAESRFSVEEAYLNDAENRIRSFLTRITTSDRTSLMQQEKSERIVCMRYVTAFSVWRAEQDQQSANLVNQERKARYRVYEAEGLGFGEIDAVKQGILSEIAREHRRKQEAKLAAIREMELFHQHQRRLNDEEESAGRNVLRNEEQTLRAQMRLAMVDDRKAANEAAHQRHLHELQRWRHQCWLEQQPLIKMEEDHRHGLRLDESTAFRLLSLLRHQLWDELLSPLVLFIGEEGYPCKLLGRRQKTALDSALGGLPAAVEGTLSPKAKLSKELRPAAAGVTKLRYELCVSAGSAGVQLCPGVTVRRRMDMRHYTSQPLTQVCITVRIRSGGCPGDELELNSQVVQSLREKAALSAFIPGSLMAAVSAPTPSKGVKATPSAALDLPPVDHRAVAELLRVPSLRTLESTVYDEDGTVLCTVDATDSLPPLDDCASCSDWCLARNRLRDEQESEDGILLCAFAFAPIDKDNTRCLDRVLQELVFFPSTTAGASLLRRHIEVEVMFFAQPKRRASSAALVASRGASSGLTKEKSEGKILHRSGSNYNMSTSSSPTTLSVVQHRLVISVSLIPTAPMFVIGPACKLLTHTGLRSVSHFDLRGPSVTIPSTGKGAPAQSKPMVQLMANVLGERVPERWWRGNLLLRSASQLPPLVSDFQGSALRLRITEGAASEDTLVFVPNEEFTVRKEDIRFTPPAALTNLEPLTCARLAHGKIVPMQSSSSKDIWFAIPEAPSYWAPSLGNQSYIPSLIIERLLSRFFFTTTSGSTAKRVVEVTLVCGAKKGGLNSVQLRIDLCCSGLAATCCGTWAGLDDLSNIQGAYVESALLHPEHLRQYLASDAVSLLPAEIWLESNSKLSGTAPNALVGPGAVRVSVVENPFLWDTLDVVGKCAQNKHGLLTVVPTHVSHPSAPNGLVISTYKLMWSVHADEATLVHVGTMKRTTSAEGAVRPGVVVELTDQCRLGAVNAILQSLTFATSVPESAFGTTKAVLIEIWFSSGGDALSKLKSSSSPNAKAGQGISVPVIKAGGQDASAAVVQACTQALASSTGPMRVTVHLHCAPSVVVQPQTTGFGPFILPRLPEAPEQCEAQQSSTQSTPQEAEGIESPGSAATESHWCLEVGPQICNCLTLASTDVFDNGAIEVSCLRIGHASVASWQIGLLLTTGGPATSSNLALDDSAAQLDLRDDVSSQGSQSGLRVSPTQNELLNSASSARKEGNPVYTWADTSAEAARNRTLMRRRKESDTEQLAALTIVTPSIARCVQALNDRAVMRSGVAAISLGTVVLHLGGKRRQDLLHASPSIVGGLIQEIISKLVVSPLTETALESLEPANTVSHLALAPPSVGVATVAQAPSVQEEMICLRLAVVDTFKRRHQLVIPVEITPKNLPSYFANTAGSAENPTTWRMGNLGYLGGTLMPLLQDVKILDEDTEFTGEGAYLRIEPLCGATSEDRLVFLTSDPNMESLSSSSQHMRRASNTTGAFKFVEFVEPVKDGGELRRYHVRRDIGRGEEKDIGSATLAYGTSTPSFHFVFVKDVDLPTCTEVLRRVYFEHTNRFPSRLQTRQFLVRFNAMDGEGVVDTKYVYHLNVAQPIMYTMPLYETARLRFSDRVKQVQLFPRVLIGCSNASSLGRRLSVRLETTCQDESLELLIGTDVRQNLFTEHNNVFISFSCQFAATLLSSAGVQRPSNVFAGLSGFDDMPVPPTPGYDGVLFGKIATRSATELVIDLATDDMTRGNETLTAVCIPTLLSKIAFRSQSIEPLPVPRSAVVKWEKNASEQAELRVSILVESGEPVATLVTEVDSVHVFSGHAGHLVPDVELQDISADMVVGKEAILSVHVRNGVSQDRLTVAPRSLRPTPGVRISFLEDSGTICVDEDEVASVEIPPGEGKLIVRFLQCPVLAVQELLRRIVFSTDDASSLGKARLVEITLRVYASQPTPATAHVQVKVHPFPFITAPTFAGRLVDYRSATGVPVLRSMHWCTSVDQAHGGATTQGLTVHASLLPASTRIFQSLLSVDDSTFAPPDCAAAVPGCDRLVMRALPSHLVATGGGGVYTVTVVGKGTHVCHIESSPDYQHLWIRFSVAKAVAFQLVQDVLWSVGFEYSEAPPLDGADSGVVAADTPQAKKPAAAAVKGKSAAMISAPQVITSVPKGERRYLAVRVELSVPAARGESAGHAVTGDEVVPICCVL